ncbi:helicase-related protein [Glutamicibacter arilaitensis]|uniref:helicase-related protein n=1 Tax=Glutamicibacter arilaitensis TaxID=256701 RepID=UPI003FD3B61D
MTNPEALVHVNCTRIFDQSESTEHVKVERYYYTRLKSGQLYLYDQFLRSSFEMPGLGLNDETEAVRKLAGRKNLVYLNRPKKVEEIAKRLAISGEVRVDNVLESALQAIADYVHPEYKLIDFLRHGVAFHHGGMPDLIRIYVEELFANESSAAPAMLVSTSTLLEGVNTPADTLFILNPWKGPKHLSPSQFRNLAGRVGRFKEIFSPSAPQLNLLEPRVFIFDGVSSGNRFIPETFLHRVADVRVDASAPAENVLLENVEGEEHRHVILERLENLEPGISQLTDTRLLTTPAGLGALAQGVDDYDLFENEKTLQGRVDRWRTTQDSISTCTQLIFAIWRIFLEDLPIDEKKSANIARVASSAKAREFYAMFLEWRAQGMSLREMVSREISYFKRQQDALVFVGASWGDTTLGEGWKKLWMRPSEKSPSELATLAVAKIKEEQDFVDFFLMKYVETLRELDLVVDSLYHRIKYGTDDASLILCIQNGLSLELAKLVLGSYPSFVMLDHAKGVIEVESGIVDHMLAASENEILVFEASRLA